MMKACIVIVSRPFLTLLSFIFNLLLFEIDTWMRLHEKFQEIRWINVERKGLEVKQIIRVWTLGLFFGGFTL